MVRFMPSDVIGENDNKRVDVTEYAILTHEEIRLLEESDVELQDQAVVLSFDVNVMRSRLGAALKSGENWAVIVHTHLYLDHILTQILIGALMKPKALQVDRLSFSQKVAFLDALGLLSDELKRTVLAINKVRNKIAHEIDFNISAEDQNRLRYTVSSEAKASFGFNKEDNSFGMLTRVAIGLAETERANNVLNRLQQRQASIRFKLWREKVRIFLDKSDPQ
jgi:hypothetical protein